MNFLLIKTLLQAFLGKGWKFMKEKVFPFIVEYRNVVIMLLLVGYIVHQDNLIEQEEDRTRTVELQFEQYKLDQERLHNQAVLQYKERETNILNQQIEIEKDYAEQLKKLTTDRIATNNVINSLHETINHNTSKYETLSVEQARVYTKSLSDVLRECSTEVGEMATNADNHKLAEHKAVDQYNALVDELAKDYGATISLDK